MRKKTDLKQRVSMFSFHVIMTVIVFLILYVTVLIAATAVIALIRVGIIPIHVEEMLPDAERVIVFMSIASLAIGTVLTAFTSRFQMKPVEKLVHNLRTLAAGNYKTRISYQKPYDELPPIKAITESFNLLAEELEHTEMLRSDFVNNFSHEFKTPISSIAGFANLARNGDLTEEQRNEYLEVIEKEARRLSQFATNILNMTRVENQTILTEKTTFSLSEQIRSCFILLEEKWSQKEQEFELDFGEYSVYANEELLSHVWRNLLENAIKFAPDDGLISVTIEKTASDIVVCVTNTGSDIPENVQERIFNKFYQADESHASAGNGIGLSIVKKVVELHDGEIDVASGDGRTSFTVKIPQ